jgi:putative ABC transport system permease protein
MKRLPAALRLVRLVGRLVPRWRRGEWEREWQAELHAQARDGVDGESTALARSAGAFADAMSLRSQAMYLDLWLGDVRFAWRAVARRPAFTALVVLTLALGIGVNSAVFALVDAVLLRPLPYRDPSRLAFVWQTLPEHNVFELEATPFDYAAWHEVKSLAQIGLVAADAFTLTGSENPERIRGSRVTSSVMPLLGIAPQIGRAFAPEEDASGAERVVILSDGLWRRRYGADLAILGRSIQVNGVPRTVVGVMPRGTSLPGPLAGDDELWLPAEMTGDERTNDTSHNYTVLARLAGGTMPAQASAELEAFAARMTAQHPTTHRGLGVRLVPFAEQAVVTIRPTLLVIAGGVALLLLVACANASTLLIARASNRRQELAVRTALGATRSRLLSLAVTECLILAVLGGLAGLLLGGWALRGLLPLFTDTLPSTIAVDVDARVALFTAVVSAVLGLVFGAVVAAHGPDDHLSDSLKTSGRTTTAHRAARARTTLVVAQIALAVVLLSAAGLMLSSVVKLSRVGTGFAADHVLTTRVALSGSNYSAAPARIAFTRSLLERLHSAPGIEDAALTSTIPFGGTRGANGIEVEGRPTTPGEILIVDQRHVSPGYFQAMKIPLLRGRTFTPSDDSQAEPVVVINREMATRYWPNTSPIDKRVRLSAGDDAGPWIRIVGVAEDVRHISLSRGAVPEMYRPYTQAPVATFTLVVRATGEPASIAPIVRSNVQAVDPDLPVYDVRTMEDRIATSFAQTRGTMLLLVVTAGLAAALAAVAIYGSIWYSVSQRLPEIGIRLALGATPASVFAQVLRNAVWLTAIGAGIGTAASIAAGRLIAGLLFDTATTDPATYAMVVGAVLALSVAASVVPARRAMSVDPYSALRAE